MPKAILVSLTRLYDDIAPTARLQGSSVLRNTTCCWWRVNEENAVGVEYAFGVYRGAIVSAYRVVAPVELWPVLPKGAKGAERKGLPVRPLSEADWRKATTWTGVGMYGPVRYAEVSLDSTGGLAEISFPNRPALDAETGDTDDDYA